MFFVTAVATGDGITFSETALSNRLHEALPMTAPPPTLAASTPRLQQSIHVAPIASSSNAGGIWIFSPTFSLSLLLLPVSSF